MNTKRWHHGFKSLAVVGALFSGLGAHALAQEAPAAPSAETSFTEPEFAKIASMLGGSWKSSRAITVGADAFEVMMGVAPVTIRGLPNAMYVEVARADRLDRPYRQAIWQLYRHQGKLRLKTLEFRRARGELLPACGTWAASEAFPAIKLDDLIATLDIELSGDIAKGYMGATPYPYPTAAGGANEMTSEVSFNGDRFSSADRGYGADGSVLWGPAKGEQYEFARVAPWVTVARYEGGLVSLTYPSSTEGEAFGTGQRMILHYIGSLEDGQVFDSSYERNAPFQWQFGQPLIAGWAKGMEDAKKGTKRRLIIPGSLGYGEQGNPRAKIGPNATLYFTIDVVDIETPPPQPAAPPVPGQAAPAEQPPQGDPKPQ
jgi:hypothetical protein